MSRGPSVTRKLIRMSPPRLSTVGMTWTTAKPFRLVHGLEIIDAGANQLFAELASRRVDVSSSTVNVDIQIVWLDLLVAGHRDAATLCFFSLLI